MGTQSKGVPLEFFRERQAARKARMLTKHMKMINKRRSPKIMRKVRRELGYKLWG
jgi:hypothetical protein